MLKYHVVNKDASKCILWITGAGVSQWMYTNQMELPYKHIVFDLPGHGENSDIDFISIDDVIHEIREILEVENMQSTVIVGHSIGAQILMRMMEISPEVIEYAFVISGLNNPMTWALCMLKPTVAMTMPLIKYRWFSKLQSKEISLPDGMFERYYEDSMMISKKTLLNILKENMSFEMAHNKLNGDKITFIVGLKEKKMMINSVEKNHKMIKGSKLIKLEAAHGIPYELPKELNNTIENTLKEQA